ncbi:MAG: cation:proton antiporter [Thermoplasmata archaeon]
MASLLSPVAYYALLEVFVFLAFAEVLHSLGQRIGLPQIVADLIAGMILSSYAVGSLLNDVLGVQLFVINDYVMLFATFSVVLLLFAAGLEGGFSSLRTAGVYAIFGAIAGDLVSFAVVFVVFVHFTTISAALLIAVASAATSTAVVAQFLRSEALGGTAGGKFLINVAALDDVVALILLSVVLTILGGKFDPIAVTGNAVEAVAAWVVILLVSVLIIPRLLRVRALRESRDVPFAILFALVAIVVVLGFSAVIGAFIAGLAVAESLVASRTREITLILTAIFGSLFFVVIGAQFDVGLLLNPNVLALAFLLAGLAAAGKFLGVLPFAQTRLRSPADGVTVAIGMIPRGEIGLLVGAIGVSSGIFDTQLLGVIVLMSIVTTLVGAVLFRQRILRQTLETPKLDASVTASPGP